MTTPPTYYRELNTFRFSGITAAVLSIGFIAANLKRRSQSNGLTSDAVFAASLLLSELGFYVS